MAGLVIIGLFVVVLMQRQQEEAAPKAPTIALTRGINLDGWFRDNPSPSEITRQDLQRIRAMGLDFVRLPVDPALLSNERGLDASRLVYLDQALDLIRREALAVVVDLFARTVVGWSMKPSLCQSGVSPDRRDLSQG